VLVLYCLEVSKKPYIPIPEKIEWIISDDGFCVIGTGTRSGRKFSGPDSIKQAYAASMPGETAYFGVEGSTGEIHLGHSEDRDHKKLLVRWRPDGSAESTKISITGLDTDASSRIGPIFLGDKYSFVEKVHFYNCAIEGTVRQKGEVGDILFSHFTVNTKCTVAVHMGFAFKRLTLHGYYEPEKHNLDKIFHIEGSGDFNLVSSDLHSTSLYGLHYDCCAEPGEDGILIEGCWSDGFQGKSCIEISNSVNGTVGVQNNNIINTKNESFSVSREVLKAHQYHTREGLANNHIEFEGNTFKNKCRNGPCLFISSSREISFRGSNKISNDSGSRDISIGNDIGRIVIKNKGALSHLTRTYQYLQSFDQFVRIHPRYLKRLCDGKKKQN